MDKMNRPLLSIAPMIVTFTHTPGCLEYSFQMLYQAADQGSHHLHGNDPPQCRREHAQQNTLKFTFKIYFNMPFLKKKMNFLIA